MNERIIRGTVYVLGDNIDTDQILTAEYMKINPASPEGYRELGALAMCGLPDHHAPFVDPASGKAYHSIIVAGHNFGCGSSREHAPMALGASGVQAVIAESFARIFYRNCISTGEILPVECHSKITELVRHGDTIEIYPDKNQIFIEKDNSWFTSEGLGDMLDIVNAGGLFNFARQSGRLTEGRK